MPDLLHIIPVGDDSVFNGVFQGKDTSLGLSFISNIGILLSHTDHDTLVTGTANNGWEDSPGGRHHQRIQLCTCRNHCQRQERRYLRHTSCFFEDLLENQMIKQKSEVDL